MRNRFEALEYAISVTLAELRLMNASGPHFRIIHRFRQAGADCTPGEEIVAVEAICHAREFQLPLSLTARTLFDYLARHARIAQSSRQIEVGIRRSPFYYKLGPPFGKDQGVCPV